ncbi:PP2C family protein-serine/threonine phosphatase [Streptomyces sp. NPDC049577]|uniref:PP2C family protein-serine/threonine phosphatase n=1 Tax=Streptomyces sp. NPDC049577 TaxID=3155153 RepID=UPI00344A61E3
MSRRRHDDAGGGDKGPGRLSDPDLQVPAPPAWLRWLPVTYVMFVLVLEPLTPVQWPVSFLLVALPVIAAFTLGPVGVAGFTVFAVGLEGTLAGSVCCAGRVTHDLWERHYVGAYVSTAVVGVLGTALAAHRRRQEFRLLHASSIAEALMRTLLRPVPRRVGRVLAAGLYRPAEAVVGGDLFDIRTTECGERAVIGDVRGKGMPAVRTVADLLGCFRQTAHDPGDLLHVADTMERCIAREAAAIADDELFVTAALVEYDPVAHRVTIVNRGHVEPVLISRGEVEALSGPPSLPLGLGSMTTERPGTYDHPLLPGDVLVLCTDGLVEARDESGTFYPLLDRLRDRFAGRPQPEPGEVVDFLDTDLPRHARALQDDVAVLALAPVGATAVARSNPDDHMP